MNLRLEPCAGAHFVESRAVDRRGLSRTCRSPLYSGEPTQDRRSGLPRRSVTEGLLEDGRCMRGIATLEEELAREERSPAHLLGLGRRRQATRLLGELSRRGHGTPSARLPYSLVERPRDLRVRLGCSECEVP